MKKSLALVLSIMLFVLMGCSMLGEKEAEDKVATPTTDEKTESTTDGKDDSKDEDKPSTTSDDSGGAVSIANYEKLKLDMSYDDVKGVMGSGGEETSSSGSGDNEYKNYRWKDDNKNMYVSFRNDKATSIRYSGYPSAGAPRDADLSKDKYDKIKNGMSYSDVKELIGSDGILTSSSKSSSSESKSYTWRGEKYSSVRATFRNGELSSKSQSNVK